MISGRISRISYQLIGIILLLSIVLPNLTTVGDLIVVQAQDTLMETEITASPVEDGIAKSITAGSIRQGLSQDDWQLIKTLLPRPAAIIPDSQDACLKASNAESDDIFGYSVAISGDTVVVGAQGEDSSAAGGQSDNSASYAGAVYVFVRSGDTWSQQAYLKASNAESGDRFGLSVATSGNTVVVGAPGEDSSSSGGQSDNSASFAGAAYVFVRSGDTWSQQTYLKASNAQADDRFGLSVAISGDSLVIGADGQDSAAGAAYVFARSDSTWSDQGYLKASNAQAGDSFGRSVSISENLVVVGAYQEDSSAAGGQSDNSTADAGAAYVFVRSEGIWSQQAYIKASNAEAEDWFGVAVSISEDSIVVGAYQEDSSGTGGQSDNSATDAGAAYVFVRSGDTWTQQAYIKASNAQAYDTFGDSVAISGDALVVGASGEDSSAAGGQSDNSILSAGAAYVYTRVDSTWTQGVYLKASNAENSDQFGRAVGISGDMVAVSSPFEDSSASGGQSDNSEIDSGAAYVYVPGTIPTPIKPSGETTDTTPRYIWNKLINATDYQLQLFKGSAYIYTKFASSGYCGAAYCSRTPTELLNNADYQWRVRAKVDGVWGAYSTFKTFTANDEPIPIPKKPTEDITDTTPKYAWTKVDGAALYQFQLYQGNTFVYNQFATSGYCGPTYCGKTPPTTLGNDDYQWRIRAKVDGVWGFYSTFKLFTLNALVTPAPLNPSGDTTDTTPSYSWTEVTGATDYQFQVYADAALILNQYAPSDYCGAAYCSKTPSTVLDFDDYTWQIRAKVGGVWGAWSSSKAFTVKRTGFQSSFNLNKNGWTTVNGSWDIFNSSYLRTYGLEDEFGSTYYDYDWTKLSYAVRMKMDNCTVCFNGLYVRGTPSPLNTYGGWNSGYSFMCSENGWYTVRKLNNGGFTTLKEWTESAAINQGDWNTLKVIAIGSELKFFINNTLVWTGTDSLLAQGKVGISTYEESSTDGILDVDWAILTTDFTTAPENK